MSSNEDALWKPHAGSFSWPTVGLAIVVVGLVTLAWSSFFPLWVSSAIATLAAYLAFTVMHEACHGNIHGRHRRWSKASNMLGWLVSVTLFAPYPAFRVLHLRHHSHTNHPDKDPDYFIAGPAGMAMLRGLLTVPTYYAEFLFGRTGESTSGLRARRSVIICVACYITLAATLSALGMWLEVLVLWIGPALVAAAALAFSFDWLPHHPHESRERYRDTRAIDVRILDVLLLGQNLHLVHHLYPRVPFYRYRAVFTAGRAHFEERGATIVGGKPRVGGESAGAPLDATHAARAAAPAIHR